ncbi:MAG: hypothetical protein JWN03_8944 [Nocardia sp.]|nr:hypothetical protein [Nocardia sp.]
MLIHEPLRTGPAGPGKLGRVSSDVSVIVLLALAGFLLGGAYSTWKTLRPLAIALGVAGVLAVGGAILYVI